MSKAGREQEVREMITKVSALTSRNVELEGSNTSLQKRMAELQKEMDELSGRISVEMAAKDMKCQKSSFNTLLESNFELFPLLYLSHK